MLSDEDQNLLTKSHTEPRTVIVLDHNTVSFFVWYTHKGDWGAKKESCNKYGMSESLNPSRQDSGIKWFKEYREAFDFVNSIGIQGNYYICLYVGEHPQYGPAVKIIDTINMEKS